MSYSSQQNISFHHFIVVTFNFIVVTFRMAAKSQLKIIKKDKHRTVQGSRGRLIEVAA